MNKAISSLGTVAALSALLALGACDEDDKQAQVAQPVQPLGFQFDATPANSPMFLRVDRTGAPAIGTALLSRSEAVVITGVGGGILNPGIRSNNFNDQRDQLNRGDPVNDARDFASIFVAGPQPNSLRNIHFKIAGELRALGLTPCSTVPAGGAITSADVNVDACVAQAAPVILPDVIVYDFSQPEGFPNGRTYDDPVVDMILAAALLRISPNGSTPAPHGLNSLVGVLNTWNGPAGTACPAPCRFTGDETGTVSPATFPYLRTPHP